MESSGLLSFAPTSPPPCVSEECAAREFPCKTRWLTFESPVSGTQGNGKGRMKQRKTRLICARSRQGWLGCFHAKCCCVSGVGKQQCAAGWREAPHSHLPLPTPPLLGFSHKAQPSTTQRSHCLGHDVHPCSEPETMGRRAVATMSCPTLTPYYPPAHA